MDDVVDRRGRGRAHLDWIEVGEPGVELAYRTLTDAPNQMGPERLNIVARKFIGAPEVSGARH